MKRIGRDQEDHSLKKIHCKDQSEDTFQVYPISKFSSNFPYFRQPAEIGCFSQDDFRNFRHDKSQLKNYIAPEQSHRVSFDLRNGYSEFIKRDDTKKEYLEHLLTWIALNRNKFTLNPNEKTKTLETDLSKEGLNTDFVCWRGLLTKLLCSPYENREGWKIAVIKHQGTFYMCEFDTEQRTQHRINMTDKEKEMTYWGFKFEQYVTATPGCEPDTCSPVNNHSGFCSVVRSRLKNHSLVFGGEIDCYEEENEKKVYIELKTSRELYHKGNERNFKKFKLIKWWAQSFLIGIPKIVCGFRNDDGIVQRLQPYNVLELPKMAKEVPDSWDAATCFNFCSDFLDYVKATVKEHDTRQPYVFEWEPNDPVRWKRHGPDSEYALMLPDWFCEGQTSPCLTAVSQ